MTNKADILLHPVRMKIIRTLMKNNKHGLTPLKMANIIGDVSQATLYRHIQQLAEADIIRVLKEKKVRAVTEKYYVVNMEQATFNQEEWEDYLIPEKLNYYSYYQLSLYNLYENYLHKIEKEEKSDAATLSMIDLYLNEPTFQAFQQELNDLVMKYHTKSIEHPQENKTSRSIGITIIPDTE